VQSGPYLGTKTTSSVLKISYGRRRRPGQSQLASTGRSTQLSCSKPLALSSLAQAAARLAWQGRQQRAQVLGIISSSLSSSRLLCWRFLNRHSPHSSHPAPAGMDWRQAAGDSRSASSAQTPAGTATPPHLAQR